MRRPVGRLGLAILTLAIATAPAVLFFDPVDIGPGRGHIAREPLAFYRLFSDDVAYVASSRNWQRTVSQPVRAAQHPHRAGLANRDLGTCRLLGQPGAIADASWRSLPIRSWSPSCS